MRAGRIMLAALAGWATALAANAAGTTAAVAAIAMAVPATARVNLAGFLLRVLPGLGVWVLTETKTNLWSGALCVLGFHPGHRPRR
jgi:hypothetical protein